MTLRIKILCITIALMSGLGIFLLHVQWVFVFMLPLILFNLGSRREVAASVKILGVCLAIIIITASGMPIAKSVIKNIINPPEWDFLSFWINGRIAILGQDFYDPRNYHAVAQFLNVSNDFKREILDVGFWYPPFSILLFAPLGLFDVRFASIIWYVLNLSALGLGIYLLWKTFFSDDGLVGLIFTCSLVLMVRSILSTAEFGQTNYLVLLFLTLFWKDRTLLRGGIWMGLCIFIKPFMAILLVYAWLRKYWRPSIVAIMFLAVASGITAMIYGPEIFFKYFVSNPMSKMPGSVYTEWINQSLSAVLARAAHLDPEKMLPIANPMYLAISAIVFCIAGLLCFRFSRKNDDWSMVLMVSTSLMIYPATLDHYSLLLIVPLFAFWAHRKEIRWEWKLVLPCYIIVIGLINFQRGDFSFWANVLIWLIAAGMGLGLKKNIFNNKIPIG